MKLSDHSFFARDLEADIPVAVRGEGVWIWDDKGKKYLDGCAGANVSGIGHGVGEIGEVMAEQAKKIAYVPPQHFLNQPTLDLCNKILEHAPDIYTRVMLCSTGSEAIENAMKIARQYHVHNGNPSKYRMISRWQGFHGNTIAADSVSGTKKRRSISSPMLMDCTHICAAHCYHCKYRLQYPGCDLMCARELDAAIINDGPENVSAFICETVVGAASCGVNPPQEYFPMIRQTCDKHDVLWIADEIMAGVGRTGTFLAVEQWGVFPDLVVLAKGLSCGYAPVSAILISDKVFKAFERNNKAYVGGHTYNAHPITASVGIKVINYMYEHGVIEHVAEKGAYLKDLLLKLASRHPIIGEVRGRGLFLGVEFVADREKREPFPLEAAVAKRIVAYAMENGLVVYPSQGGCADGELGDAIQITPPLIISKDEMDYIYNVLDDVIGKVEKEMGITG